MAVGKEIRTKISSIKNTQKITKAMEMVAASKMRRTQDRMQATRPYARRMQRIIRHLAHAHPEYRHPYLLPRDGKRVGILLVSTDRGLCGGLNANLFRGLLRRMKEWEDDGHTLELSVIGQKGASFFSGVGANIVAQKTQLGDEPHLEDIIGVVKVMLDKYDAGELDQLYLVFNEFVNTMTQKPVIQKLLPAEVEAEEDQLKHHWDYIYEPDAKEVLDELLMRYVESIVFQGVVENKACEQAARMVAMKSASDNAGKFIDELQLLYNKARQASITQEISEIVSGAAAIQQ
ncbi:F-type H+-transporting ATPase subunit gamma [Methylomarinovum caldicuralii]|uniref:ATP synthase gamma chain n=1 Tax=Methylomarinovum caldicuralii TaxID=438856 RepID=A0AAU9BR06_9GAMM|nr:F0F1 ATP synthase subunit gamma [Methylomarinovum caldicuralii]BCX81198.1 F-type H+-transporting ATPase subunit gamma [Methylomarinovum caldicuralii]